MSNSSLISKKSKYAKILSPNFCNYYASLFSAISIILFLSASCGRIPTAVSTEETGALEVRTCIQSSANLSKTMAKLAVTSDSLIIEISGSDINTLRFSKVFDLSRPVHTDTLTRIPTGSNRQLKVYTIDRSGTIIHTDTNSHRYIRIDPNSTTPISVVLMPAVGSIYLQLENIPAKVDSVIATFTADDLRSWTVRAKKSAKLYLSLDKIPNALHGFLTVAAIDSLKDTLYSAKKELTFNAAKMENIALNFSTTPGRLSFAIIVDLPGVTSAIGNMAATDTSGAESGDIFITEIMCKDGLEYIEVYNPNSINKTFDSLYIDINDKKPIAFTNIAIGSQKSIVFVRDTFSWRDSTCYLAKSLDLLSSSGNSITIRSNNNLLIDRVTFPIGTNSLEWPIISGTQAIVLDTNVNDANLNNFGRNWRTAMTLIPGTTDQYGSPKIR